MTPEARRLRRRARAIARPALYHLLQSAFVHAAAPYAGSAATAAGVEVIRRAVADAILEIADLGALLYFGIRDSLDLGEVPIVFRFVTEAGHFVFEADPAIDLILAGGARGDGWSSPADLTLADLAR